MDTLPVKFKLSAKLASTSKGITGYLMLDDEIIDKYTFTQSGEWEKEFGFDFTEGQHRIGFTVNNKSNFDTIVDSNNNIIDDTLITFEHLEIDEIEITELFEREAKFFDTTNNLKLDVMKNIGFNGHYSFEFATPFYEWLLSKV
jgi:hypothetical protein